jgi:hypothetical protein
MPWRLAAVLILALAGLNMSQTQASSRTLNDPTSVRQQTGFENDNNVVDTLFQNFNGNESSDGGHKKKSTLGPLPAPVSAPVAPPSSTEAHRRARAGRETVIFLTNDRVVVRVPAANPDDLELSIKIVPAPVESPPPGPVVGGLVFQLAADAFSDAPPERLPIEVNLSARYTDAELGTRDESRLMLSWLDPADKTWKPAPKLAADPRNNFISATIQNLGVYAVHQAP